MTLDCSGDNDIHCIGCMDDEDCNHLTIYAAANDTTVSCDMDHDDGLDSVDVTSCHLKVQCDGASCPLSILRCNTVNESTYYNIVHCVCDGHLCHTIDNSKEPQSQLMSSTIPISVNESVLTAFFIAFFVVAACCLILFCAAITGCVLYAVEKRHSSYRHLDSVLWSDSLPLKHEHRNPSMISNDKSDATLHASSSSVLHSSVLSSKSWRYKSGSDATISSDDNDEEDDMDNVLAVHSSDSKDEQQILITIDHSRQEHVDGAQLQTAAVKHNRIDLDLNQCSQRSEGLESQHEGRLRPSSMDLAANRQVSCSEDLYRVIPDGNETADQCVVEAKNAQLNVAVEPRPRSTLTVPTQSQRAHAFKRNHMQMQMQMQMHNLGVPVDDESRSMTGISANLPASPRSPQTDTDVDVGRDEDIDNGVADVVVMEGERAARRVTSISRSRKHSAAAHDANSVDEHDECKGDFSRLLKRPNSLSVANMKSIQISVLHSESECDSESERKSERESKQQQQQQQQQQHLLAIASRVSSNKCMPRGDSVDTMRSEQSVTTSVAAVCVAFPSPAFNTQTSVAPKSSPSMNSRSISTTLVPSLPASPVYRVRRPLSSTSVPPSRFITQYTDIPPPPPPPTANKRNSERSYSTSCGRRRRDQNQEKKRSKSSHRSAQIAWRRTKRRSSTSRSMSPTKKYATAATDRDMDQLDDDENGGNGSNTNENISEEEEDELLCLDLNASTTARKRKSTGNIKEMSPTMWFMEKWRKTNHSKPIIGFTQNNENEKQVRLSAMQSFGVIMAAPNIQK
eukprot:CAMPEP_0202695492 /NCGR_PEP_ID=MMETSP1385-20130828/9074_1 /ASSEMBLY_ACC=CAM_ASM_000861 /TAXON_ID=933848 /ORGANISM="Elphidium margaritaceum" /LENGTH=794 /DNA_ID=CAMNT_0049351525 /DNA_START=93 /DNA_END=2477 /DNA_ORIENTATION=+